MGRLAVPSGSAQSGIGLAVTSQASTRVTELEGDM